MGRGSLMNENSNQKRFALDVVKKLRDAGFDALWAGGCVRDHLLGKTPKDYDIATNARPDEVRGVFGRQRTIAIGESFGVITVLGKKSEGQIDVATFRRDAGYSDGRHPDSVKFSNAEEDARRRDFTVNGLFFDPIEGTVIDYVSGQDDIRKKVIRAIGNPEDRIAEDKLRMLRAVRFAATYEFELEEATLAAIQRNALAISVVSRERIAAELRRMFAHANRALAVKCLAESHLLEGIFHAPDLIDHSRADRGLKLIGLIRTNRFEPALAAFLIPMLQLKIQGEKQVRGLGKLLNQWKFSNDESRLVVWLLKSYAVVLNGSAKSWPKVHRVLVHDQVEELMSLCTAVSRSESGRFEPNIDYSRQQLGLPPGKLNPEPILSGDDLKSAGFQPGPQFKNVLEMVRDMQLDGLIHTTDEALVFAQGKLVSGD